MVDRVPLTELRPAERQPRCAASVGGESAGEGHPGTPLNRQGRGVTLRIGRVREYGGKISRALSDKAIEGIARYTAHASLVLVVTHLEDLLAGVESAPVRIREIRA